MKQTIAFLLITLSTFVVRAQDPDTFILRDGDIIWQKVYQTDMDSTAVVGYLQASGQLKDFTNTPGGLVCSIIPRQMDYRGAGFRYIQVVAVVLDNEMEGTALIQFKDGRYRVTVNHIRFVSELPMFPDLTMADFIDRKGIQKVFYSKNTAAILDYELNSIFEISETEDSW